MRGAVKLYASESRRVLTLVKSRIGHRWGDERTTKSPRESARLAAIGLEGSPTGACETAQVEHGPDYTASGGESEAERVVIRPKLALYCGTTLRFLFEKRIAAASFSPFPAS